MHRSSESFGFPFLKLGLVMVKYVAVFGVDYLYP
jgi:hypothetical protein